MTPHEILIAAKKRCSAKRWRQGDDACVGGNTCAMLAIIFVASSDDVEPFSEAERVFLSAIDAPSIVTWNDEYERTYQDVADAFDRAIEATRPT